MQNIPLSERVRPKSISEIVGQQHLIGQTSVLLKSIKKGIIPSIIFWGPPGVGKTTLSRLIALELKRPFYSLSAVNSGVKDIRKVIEKAKSLGLFGKDIPILFIDEIHRFTKAQQDSLLESVEKGIITLVGATTENPSFEVISPLLSRMQVYILETLSKKELLILLDNAIKNDVVLRDKKIQIKETDALLINSSGDARKLLNIIELAVASHDNNEIVITNKLISELSQKNLSIYDKNGEQHYDIISAFIKSIRGSDVNAAVYWLARMIEGGEDVKFIARRLIILASEDIGNANPTALVIANNCFQAVNTVGLPESRIILSQTVIYLACSIKSNSAYTAINIAQEEVKNSGNLSVPLHLRNASTKLMKELNYGKDYKYSHNTNEQQEFMPDDIKNTIFYIPKNNSKENDFKKYLKHLWKGKYKY